MKKFFRIALILLLFVGFPLTSWYYLKEGAKWRKNALNELEYLAKVRSSHYIDGSGNDGNLLERKVCVLYMIEDDKVTDDVRKGLHVCEKIYDQFHQRPELRLVIVAPSQSLDVKAAIMTKQGADTEYWVQDGAVGAWKTILFNAMDLYTHKHKLERFKNYICLSDIDGNLRSVYDIDDEAQIKRLVQHLAILLPFK